MRGVGHGRRVRGVDPGSGARGVDAGTGYKVQGMGAGRALQAVGPCVPHPDIFLSLGKSAQNFFSDFLYKDAIYFVKINLFWKINLSWRVSDMRYTYVTQM